MKLKLREGRNCKKFEELERKNGNLVVEGDEDDHGGEGVGLR